MKTKFVKTMALLSLCFVSACPAKAENPKFFARPEVRDFAKRFAVGMVGIGSAVASVAAARKYATLPVTFSPDTVLSSSIICTGILPCHPSFAFALTLPPFLTAVELMPTWQKWAMFAAFFGAAWHLRHQKNNQTTQK